MGSTEDELITKLRTRSSEATLQSRQEGFFKNLVEQVSAHVSNEFRQKLCGMDDKQRVLELWKVDPLHTIKILRIFKSKDQEKALELRASGNKAFQEKKNTKAVLLYSQCILKADPERGDCLALGFANRAAALFHVQEFQLSLRDTELALKAGYPRNLKYKVFDRQGQCHMKLGAFSKAVESFSNALNCLNEGGLDETKQKIWQTDLNKRLKECQGKDDSVSKPKPLSRLPRFGQNAALPSASEAVSVKYSPEKGRHLVAAKGISVGETIIAEAPFASILHHEMGGSFCHHCMSRFFAALPCHNCAGVAFCTEECREAAKAYHDIECPLMSIIHGSGMSPTAHLALRIVTKQKLEFFKKIAGELCVPMSAVPSAEDPHKSDDYRTFYNLCTLNELRHADDLFGKSLMACLLVKILQKGGYFGEPPLDDEDHAGDLPPPKELNEDEQLIGSLLLRHLQILQMNSHEVTSIEFVRQEQYAQRRNVHLGMAVYNTTSLSNHSCYQAVARYFKNDAMVVMALRPISKGEEIYENYGPLFHHYPLSERQLQLQSRYWFKCDCVACQKEWPTYQNMKPIGQLMNQSKDKLQEQAKLLSQTEEMFQKGTTAMNAARREEAISIFQQYVYSVLKLVYPPHKNLHRAMENLRLLYHARGSTSIKIQPEA